MLATSAHSHTTLQLQAAVPGGPAAGCDVTKWYQLADHAEPINTIKPTSCSQLVSNSRLKLEHAASTVVESLGHPEPRVQLNQHTHTLQRQALTKYDTT